MYACVLCLHADIFLYRRCSVVFVSENAWCFIFFFCWIIFSRNFVNPLVAHLQLFIVSETFARVSGGDYGSLHQELVVPKQARRSRLTIAIAAFAVVALVAALIVVTVNGNSDVELVGTAQVGEPFFCYILFDVRTLLRAVTSNYKADLAALKVSTKKEHNMDKQAEKYIDEVSCFFSSSPPREALTQLSSFT